MRKLLLPVVAMLSLVIHAIPAAAQDAKAGETKAAMCIGCHGIPRYQASFPEVHKVPMISGQSANFNAPIDPTYPKIAGQYADYLFVALKAYQTTKNPQVGRANPVMSGMAVGLTHAQLKELSNYIASLPGELQTVPQSRLRP